jgi:outer membrane protein assembly factor BamB
MGDHVLGVGFRGDQSRVYCWNAESGRPVWVKRPGGFRATFSSPVVAGESLLIGEGLHHTRRAVVYCLDLRPGHEGDVRWSFETNGHVECTPVVDGDRVFVAAGDDGVYCLDSRPETDEADRLLWHVSGDQYPDVETALAVQGGRVFIGLGSGGEALVVLDAADGVELARLAMPYPVHGLPAITDGRLFLGMGTGNYVDHEHSHGQVACIDVDELDVLWALETPGTVLGAVASDSQTKEVIFGCADGRVVIVDQQGRPLRDWDSQAPIVTGPAVTDEMIYVVNEAGVLYGLDRIQLEPTWETRLGPPGQYVSSPIVAHGHVYVGTPTSGFVCAGNAVPGAVEESAGLPERGDVLWTYELPGDPIAPPALSSSTIVVAANESGKLRLTALENRQSSAPRLLATRSIGAVDHCSITLTDEIAVVATGSHLLALDALTIETLWEIELATLDDLVVEGAFVWTRTNGYGDSPAAQWSVHSLADGSLIRKSTGGPSGMANNEMHAEGSTLVRRRGNDPQVLWADCSSVGVIQTRPAEFGPRVYVVASGQLVCLGKADHP